MSRAQFLLGLTSVLLLVWLGNITSAGAHSIDAASLTLSEVQPGRFALSFQTDSPALQKQLRVPGRFPEPCVVQGAYLECPSASLSGTMAFPWLEDSTIRLMVDVTWLDGTHDLQMLSGSRTTMTVYGGSSAPWFLLKRVLLDYTKLGVEHIVTGFDHLLFVIALAFLVQKRRALVLTITAFTVAHSLTLALTSLGWFSLPSAPVEAMIALSIALLCSECLSAGPSLTRRRPWLLAFLFGLLHGLGLASALVEIGLPQKHLASALLSFNLGVELGQLSVLFWIFVVGATLVRFKWQRSWMSRSVIYAMGGWAAFWTMQRTMAVFGGG